MTRGLGHSQKSCRNLPTKRGIATMKSVNKKTAGFLKKQKGLKQVCRERGLIDVSRVENYKKQGRRLPDGTVDKST